MRVTRRGVHVAAAALICAMLAGCAGGGSLGWSANGQFGSAPPPPGAAVGPAPKPLPISKVLPVGQGVPVGIYETAFPAKTAAASTFAAATGVKPRMLAYYSGWGQAFSGTFAKAARASGAVPLVQLEPLNTSLTDIIAGTYDWYLVQYAVAVRAYRYPVILGFGHEMNGNWYSWGYTHSTPANYIAAWRHVVAVFRSVGANNAKWLWAVNRLSGPTTSSVKQWWPGQQWVDLVGIDGYYYTAGETFDRVYGQTMDEIRQFSSAPLLIAEVSVGTTSDRETQISGLLAGAKAHNVFALVWFDEAQHNGLYHQDWHLEDDPAAAAAFKSAVASS